MTDESSSTDVDAPKSALNYENITIPGAGGGASQVSQRSSTTYGTTSSQSHSRTGGCTPDNMDLTPGGMPEKDPGVESRGEFSNGCQYLLTCIGYAVGLGNIWRFPSVAYENGGGAFLLPYIIVSLCFGLPALYVECALGQFTQYGPAKAFQFYMPVAQGIGWAMSLISLSIAIYYNVIVAWTMVYLGYTVVNKLDRFSACDNAWNTINCTDSVMCDDETQRFFNGTCFEFGNFTDIQEGFMNETGGHSPFVSAPDEFFTYFITQKHLSFEFGGFNWKIAGCLVLSWVMTALGLWRGVKWLGRISMVTATVPYVIIIVLLVRGVTLDGASAGIEYYLTKPDFSKMLELETWTAALMQICFSLSVGQGGMLAMSSYNKRSHRCFKDAVLVMAADTFMSLIGGVAVFSVLGFMAKNSGKTIPEVVPSPLALAFVAYPEAISHMPVPLLWSFLFFFMLFTLGFSTMFGLVEGIITCICDSCNFFRKRRTLVVFGVCTLSAAIGVFFFCFQNGFHFFNIFNEYIGSFSLAVVIVFEILVVVVFYGPRYFFRDMEASFGPPTSRLSRLFGSQGTTIKAQLSITAPAFAVGVLVVTLYNMRDVSIHDNIGLERFPYPHWAIGFGLALAAVPLSAIPLFACYNCFTSVRSGKGLRAAFRVSGEHPSIRYNLTAVPSMARFWLNTPLPSGEAPLIPSGGAEAVSATEQQQAAADSGSNKS